MLPGNDRMFGEKHERRPAWRQAMQLLEAVHALTSQFPEAEQKALIQPLRQHAMDLPRKLAEAYRQHDPETMVRQLADLLPMVHEIEDDLAIARQLRLAGAWRIGSVRRSAGRLRKRINEEIDTQISKQTVVEDVAATP